MEEEKESEKIIKSDLDKEEEKKTEEEEKPKEEDKKEEETEREDSKKEEKEEGLDKKEEEEKEEDTKEDKEKERKEEKEKEEEEEKEEEKKLGKDKKKENSEEVCETFEVTDKSGEHEVVTCNSVPKKHADKKEVAAQNIILRNILLVLGVIIIAFITWMIFLNFVGTIKYEGLPFEVVSQGDLIFYKHVLPLYDGDVHYANYNFFLRKNPYNTGDIPFEGELNPRNFVAINSTEFMCDGDGIIAMANMVKPFEVAGIEVVHDPNASCDEESRYMLLHIFPGEENEIVQTGDACYDMIVKDCDILDVTEKMMLEMFMLLKEANDKIENKIPEDTKSL